MEKGARRDIGKASAAGAVAARDERRVLNDSRGLIQGKDHVHVLIEEQRDI